MSISTVLERPIAEPLAEFAGEPLSADFTPSMPDDLVIYRLSVAQYHALAAAGILNDDAPVELLEGLLVQKMTKNPPHTTATRLIFKALTTLIPPEWFVDTQEPITLVDSEPEPDIIVIHGHILDYQDKHPEPQNVALVVEVADATLKRDRGSKKRVYAGAKLPVYWVVNLVEKRIEVYTKPWGEGRKADYQTQQNYGLEDEIPIVIGEVEIARLRVSTLLPS